MKTFKQILVLIILLLFFLAFLEICAQEPAFRILEYSQDIFAYADFTLTQIALHKYQAKEANPIVNFYVKKPVLTFAVCAFGNIAIRKISRALYKENKFLAYACLIVANLARSYIIYYNLRRIK